MSHVVTFPLCYAFGTFGLMYNYCHSYSLYVLPTGVKHEYTVELDKPTYTGRENYRQHKTNIVPLKN